MKLVICVRHSLFAQWNAPEWLGTRLQQAFPDVRVVQLPSYDRLSAELADADIYVGWSLRPQQLLAARKLRWIHATAAGVSQLMSPELAASDVVLTNSRTVQGPVVAEHVIASIFALAKRLPSAVAHQARHEWAQQIMWDERPRPREVAGATLALIGFGTIGREVARMALAMGMKVVAIREHPSRGNSGMAGVEVFGHDSLDDVLARADYVVLAAPETPRTGHLIDAARLAHLRPEACLINVSRGSLLDEDALVAALREGRIAGAALDVFSVEPLPAASPLWDAPNLLLTPHTAAVVAGLWERHLALIAENLRRFLDGRPLLNLVNKHEGY